MYVENKIMYHIHNTDDYSEIWQIGNDLDNTKDFLSKNYNNALHFKPVVNTNPDNKLAAFADVIDHYLEKDQEKETYIEMLKVASGYLKNYANVEREMILELYRKEYFPNLPSRKNAIWLTEQEQLDFWKDKLHGGSTFKVNITGELFKSSDYFLPDKEMNILEAYKQAEKYWNPDFSEVDESKTEYLFQGKLKILEKLE